MSPSREVVVAVMLVPAMIAAICLQGCGGGGSTTPTPTTLGPTTAAPTVAPSKCGLPTGGYWNVKGAQCISGKQGTPQTDWTPTATQACKGPCDDYSTYQWTAEAKDIAAAIKKRNGGTIISAKNSIPKTADDLRCWFLPQYSWGMQKAAKQTKGGDWPANLINAPPWNPQPEAAYIDDAGDALGGGLPHPFSSPQCCCQEECTMEMIQLRHWIASAPQCTANATINYNNPSHNNGRVLLTRTSDRKGNLTNLRHEECMCGKKTEAEQLPFYYYVVKGPPNPPKGTPTTDSQKTKWLDSLRTAYNNLLDIWAEHPPCSGECLIMGGASDSWETYGQSTARSVYFQLRAFASFDPQALPNACGKNGIMLRFGGMTLDGNKVTCSGPGGFGPTGARCPTEDEIDPDKFHDLVTGEDDATFFKAVTVSFEMTLATDRAVATISMTDGVKITPKASACSGVPQPTLNMPWRCKNTGGVSDEKGCNTPAVPTVADDAIEKVVV